MRKIILNEKEVLEQINAGKQFWKIAEYFNCDSRVIKRYANDLGFVDNRRFNNIKGKKINNLFVLERVEDKRVGQYWRCICNCGTEKVVSGRKLVSGDIKACGCLSGGWEGYEKIPATFLARSRYGAKRRKLIFDITLKDVWDTYQNQNAKCALSGLDIFFEKKNESCSIDRIDPKFGYYIGNIQIVHKKINRLKWILTETELKYWIELICNPKTIRDIFNPIVEVNNHGSWKGAGYISGQFLSNIRNSAKKRNIKFDLNISDLWNLFLEQKGQCSITGIDLTFSKEAKASIDRINNNDHYHRDNIQFVHKTINCMKNTLSMEEFKYLCGLINKTHLDKTNAR